MRTQTLAVVLSTLALCSHLHAHEVRGKAGARLTGTDASNAERNACRFATERARKDLPAKHNIRESCNCGGERKGSDGRVSVFCSAVAIAHHGSRVRFFDEDGSYTGPVEPGD